MPRFVVERCTPENRPRGRTYGYAVRDTQPQTSTHQDIEGVGLVYCPRVIHWVGWFRRKPDAVAWAAKKEEWSRSA